MYDQDGGSLTSGWFLIAIDVPTLVRGISNNNMSHSYYLYCCAAASAFAIHTTMARVDVAGITTPLLQTASNFHTEIFERYA